MSLWEGFGLPALDAMACGAPVIAAQAGALPEVVGNAALLVDPRMAAAIAAAMARVGLESGLAQALGQAGELRAGDFRWDQTAAEVQAVLRELI